MTPEGLTGSISNTPHDRRNQSFEIGEVLFVQLNEVIDWMYIENGRLVGGHTIRRSLKKFGEEDRYEILQCIPFVVTDDDYEEVGKLRLFDAIGNADYEVIKKLIEGNPSVVKESCLVATLGPLGFMRLDEMDCLQYAIYWGDVKAVEVLLALGATPDGVNREERGAPLREAAMRGEVEAIRLLAAGGAGLDLGNCIGTTALRAAVVNNEYVAAKTLIDLGANTSLTNDCGQSLLSGVRTVEMAQLLVQSGVEINSQDDRGESPLWVALFNGFTDVAIYMIEQGADWRIKDKLGNSPLGVAESRLSEADQLRLRQVIQKRESGS